MPEMKAISLHQPWASLVAAGLKCYETRSWPIQYRGPLAIQATSRPPWPGFIDPGSVRALALDLLGPELPLGAIVAIVDVVDCEPADMVARKIGVQEKRFGDYGRGRYAWRLTNVCRLPRAVPCRGYQALWAVDEELERRILENLGGK